MASLLDLCVIRSQRRTGEPQLRLERRSEHQVAARNARREPVSRSELTPLCE